MSTSLYSTEVEYSCTSRDHDYEWFGFILQIRIAVKSIEQLSNRTHRRQSTLNIVNAIENWIKLNHGHNSHKTCIST